MSNATIAQAHEQALLVSRIRGGALAQLEEMALNEMPFHDAAFFREQIIRVAAGVRTDIEAAKEAHKST